MKKQEFYKFHKQFHTHIVDKLFSVDTHTRFKHMIVCVLVSIVVVIFYLFLLKTI